MMLPQTTDPLSPKPENPKPKTQRLNPKAQSLNPNGLHKQVKNEILSQRIPSKFDSKSLADKSGNLRLGCNVDVFLRSHVALLL